MVSVITVIGLDSLHRAAAHRVWGPLLAAVGSMAGFVAAALLGFEVVDAGSGLVAFWPPNGVVVALFVLLPSRLRPWILLGVLPGEMIADSIHGYPLLVGLGFSLTDLLESAIAGLVLLRIAKRPPRGDRQRDFFALLVAACVAPLISGLLGAAISHAEWHSPYQTSLLLWWLGDMTGILLVVSLAIAHAEPRLPTTTWRRLSAVIEVAIVIVVTLATFGLTSLPIMFAALAPLTLLAIRHGLRSTAIGTMAFAVATTLLTDHGRGLIGDLRDGTQRMVILQTFVAVTSFTVLLISATMSERRHAEAELVDLATHDPLTGLANRRLFLQQLKGAAARTARSTQDSAIVAVLVLDLDRLKAVNDHIGHAAGDAALVECAGRLEAIMRRGETAARLDGDKFAVVTESTRSRQDVVALAERIQSVFDERFAIGTAEVKVTGSLGVSVAGQGATSSELLRDADTAMNRAKATAKGGFEFFDPALRTALLRQVALDKALEDALRNHELEVHYQPIVSLTDGAILAVEALARWHHPTLGRVQPDEFIPAAEASGMIVELGHYIITEAICQAARWRREQPGTLPLGVFVNVSARELADPGFAHFVAETLHAHGLVAADICLELTERVFIDERNAIVHQNLADLTESGTRLVLDDFGSGYSALASLKRFPLAAVKIDRLFINAIQHASDDAPISRAIIGLCKTLGLAVVAEGVETQIQLNFLRRVGCDAAQGFLLGRPASASDISGLLSSSQAPTDPDRNDALTGEPHEQPTPAQPVARRAA